MLNGFRLYPSLPAADLDRARGWYENLGFRVAEESPAGISFQAGDSHFFVYPSQFAGTAQNTAASFEVDDADELLDWLAERGVAPERYDLPGLQTDDRGITNMGGMRGFWIKDSEGNVLGIQQRVG